MDRATLCFLIDAGRTLLIEKKRGVGAGMYNAPGGKIDPGETPREAAVRETREEVCVAVDDLEKRAEVRFVLGGEPFSHVHVFRSTAFSGRPRETDEARPEWFPLCGLPYDEMWDGDRYWVPRVLAGEPFRGIVRFDAAGERVEGYDLDDASF